MSETQHRWIGQSIAGRYLLGRFLGETDHSAVFATEIVHARSQKVVIKLIPADGIVIGRQLARWKASSTLSHVNLLKILDYGKCELDGDVHLYVVMEHADEDLGQILPQRALTTDETRGMIEPVIEALSFLHGQNLVHTRVHPENILAIGDQIKLSSDSISPKGETVSFAASAGAFSPPERSTGPANTAEDVWSLGATVVAALTQAAPAFGEDGELILPATLAEPFAGIARESLNKDAAQRITMAGIRAKLNPSSVPVAREAAKIAPLAVPVSKVSPPAVLERPAPISTARSARPGGARKSYFLPIAVFVVAAFLLFVVPRLLRQPSNAAASKTGSNSPALETAKPRASSTTPTVPKSAPKKSPSLEPSVTETAQPVTVAPAPPVKIASKPREEEATRGEVLDEVLPDISGKARSTIRGKVRVSVRLRVDPTGTVDSAELEAPSSSKYFSDQAIKAAKRWQFSAPEVGGRSVRSEWIVKFEFAPSVTNVHPTQVSP
jgi:TonB family protein